MRILVIAASKHGSTTDIAEVLAGELYGHGHDAVYVDAEAHKGDLPDVGDYDAFVIGSAVYFGHWMKSVRKFVDENASVLSVKPVWLFSSGPTGDPPPSDADAVNVTKLLEELGAVEHHVFTGKLDKDDLGPLERTAIRAAKAPYGDFRDWDDVRAWAAHIVDSLPEPT